MADWKRAAAEIWQAGQQRRYYPAEWQGKLTVEEGYRVQLDHLERAIAAGETLAGWKVGLTASAIRAQVGYHRPVFGYLLASGRIASGTTLRAGDLVTPLVETELCLTVDSTLRGPGITPAQARRCIVSAAPSFELVERRGDFAADPPLAMADNVQQKGYILGPDVRLPPALALRDVAAEVLINGASVDKATGREVFGDPAASVAWLANALAPFGLAVLPGQRIMSGSFTRQYPGTPGHHIEARFSGVGSAAVTFA